ncbi:MAG: NnrU family protein [Candidatus Binatia bacterium]
MSPALTIALLAFLFGGTHVGLAIWPVRRRLVAALGERGYRALFSAVAAVTFVILVRSYASLRMEGAAGFALGAEPAIRWMLMAVVAFGFVLVLLGLVAYPRTPAAMFARDVAPPRGIERISRHPFFAGTAIIGVAHVFLATRLVGAVLMAALATLAIVGGRHQDQKLLRERGPAYADYLAETSFLPFLAVLAGRQRIVWSEIGWRTPLAAVALTCLLRAVHDVIFAGGGAWLIGAVFGGAVVATFQSWRRERRRASGTSHEARLAG